ncbi:MAG: hypothetical protein CMA09_03915 [Euryarchaeota archaeon]|jgi:hypothetical protein|nr:hypothetical protein [Euryarchaeota archaeon]|tara:strand:+ start:7967 stop:8206 length:240 start_codon:yes stop_codon:yes gene_type:complete
MKVKEERATSVSHVEFEILNELIETVDLESLKQIMVDDKVTGKRWDSGAKNVLLLLENMKDRRRHRLKPEHPEYKEKEK